MTGWIKMGTGLRRHPKVVQMAAALKADRLRVVGALHAVWCVFDEHSTAGELQGYTLAIMDEEIGWRGFSRAMSDIGWLECDESGMSAPDYEEHNGPNAKRRALDAQRKGQSRHGKDEKRTPVRKVSASDADKTKNREEKRREEEIAGAKAPAARASPAAEICLALKGAGFSDVNPGHPRLLALLEAGATSVEFLGFAPKALSAAPGNPFAYLLSTVEGERKRAASGGLHRGPMPNKQEALEQRGDAVVERWLANTGATND